MAIETVEELSDGLRELINEANSISKTAEEKITQAFRYAIDVDKMTPDKARKVLYDNLTYSPQWIRKFLPKEAKQSQDHSIRKMKKNELNNKASGESSFTFNNTEQIDEENIIIPSREEIIQEAESEPTNELVDVRPKTVMEETNRLKERNEGLLTANANLIKDIQKLKEDNDNLNRALDEIKLLDSNNNKIKEMEKDIKTLNDVIRVQKLIINNKREIEDMYIDIPATKWKDFLNSVANISHLMKRDGRARFNTKNLVVELY